MRSRIPVSARRQTTTVILNHQHQSLILKPGLAGNQRPLPTVMPGKGNNRQRQAERRKAALRWVSLFTPVTDVSKRWGFTDLSELLEEDGNFIKHRRIGLVARNFHHIFQFIDLTDHLLQALVVIDK